MLFLSYFLKKNITILKPLAQNDCGLKWSGKRVLLTRVRLKRALGHNKFFHRNNLQECKNNVRNQICQFRKGGDGEGGGVVGKN